MNINNMSDMRLVLLSCCAPCSAGAIQQLCENKIDGVSDFIVLFFNPNIFPESEYNKRMNEQIKYCQQRHYQRVFESSRKFFIQPSFQYSTKRFIKESHH